MKAGFLFESVSFEAPNVVTANRLRLAEGACMFCSGGRPADPNAYCQTALGRSMGFTWALTGVPIVSPPMSRVRARPRSRSAISPN